MPLRSRSSSAVACSSPSNRTIPSPGVYRLVSEAMSSRVIGAPASFPRAASMASRSAGSRKGPRSRTSSSVLSPMPSPSASDHSSGSSGKASSTSRVPSLSSSGSALSAIPSASASNQSLGSRGAASDASTIPSPSESGPAARCAAIWKRMMSSVSTESAPSSSSASTPQGTPWPQSARGSENTPPSTHQAYAMMVPSLTP